MNRRDESGTTSLRALAIVIAIGVVAHAGLPYLPLVGPPPLRQVVVKTPPASGNIKYAAPPVVSQTNAIYENASVPLPSAPGAGSDSAAAIFYGPSVPPFNLEADNALNNLFGPPVFALPSQQFFSVTPQMLATYFRPGERVSRNAMVVGPIPVGFMPPQPLPMPAISNRAAYIIK